MRAGRIRRHGIVVVLAWLLATAAATWADGWFAEGDRCSRCDSAWGQWEVSGECTSCKHFMYLDPQTKMWKVCNDAEYYDPTIETCRSCQGKCNRDWDYQAFWFEWASGEVFDMELFKCVSTCALPKLLMRDSQYSLAAFWKSPNIYIDPEAANILELGTLAYPYRFAKTAFSEVMNQFSHKDVNVTIYVKENSKLYIEDDILFLL